MSTTSVLLGNVCNNTVENTKKAEAFFKQLAENHSLHQKLDSVSWIAEDEYRGLAILSRSLFLFTMDIRDERDKARKDFAQIVHELACLKSILCSACKQNVPKEEKENDVPKQDIKFSPINLNTAKSHPDMIQTSATGPTLDRRKLREMKIYNKDYRRLSRSPKKKNAQTSPRKQVTVFLPANAPFPCHRSAGEEILAPETQTLDIPSIVKEPVDGCTSIPETMAMEDDPVPLQESYKNTHFFDNSQDVFEDSSCAEEDPSEYLTGTNRTVINKSDEALTYMHISPVLGRGGSGCKDSPFRDKLRSLNDGFSSSSGSSTSHSVSELSCSQSNADTTHGFPNVVNSIQAKYQADINASPMTSKIVNITVSPNCQSEVEFQSPSLLNVVPQRRVNSQPIGSQILMNHKSPYKSNLNQISIKFPQLSKISEKSHSKDIPSVNLSLESCEDGPNQEFQPPSSIEVIRADCMQNANLVKLSPVNQKRSLPAPDKLNKNSCLDIDKQQLHNRPSPPNSGDNVTKPTKAIPNSEQNLVSESVSVLSNHLRKGIVTDKSSSVATVKPGKPSGRVLGGSSTKPKNRSLSVAGANTLHSGQKSMTRHQSHTVTVQGSKLYNKIEVNPVATTIKKNYKQTKLTAGSFFAPKKKGNLDVSVDPLLAVAVAKSLETKELDDRRRLQLHHPALQQLQQHVQQDTQVKNGNVSLHTAAQHEQSSEGQGWLKPAGKKKKLSGGRHGSPPRPRRKSHETASDVEGSTPNKSNQPSAKRARVDSSPHDTILTESQMMIVINTSSTEEVVVGTGMTGTSIKRGGGLGMKEGRHVADKRGRCGNDDASGKDDQQSKNGDNEGTAVGNCSMNKIISKKRLYDKQKSPPVKKKTKQDLEEGVNKSYTGAIGQATASLGGGRKAETEQRDCKVEPYNAPNNRRKSDETTRQVSSAEDMKRLKPSSSRGTGLVEQETCREENLSKIKRVKRKDKVGVQQGFSDSFDRLPVATNSPGYAYAGPVERNQAKRRQMQGWSCKQCKEYYEGRDLTDEQLADHMNRCSKHRSKHQPLVSTPEGYWNPEMTDTDSDS